MAVLFELFANRQFQSIALVQMMTVFSTNLLAPVLPVYFIMQGFNESQVGFLMGIISLGALLVRPWTGLSVDLRGSRPTLLLGQVLTLTGIAAFLWLTGFWPLLLVRFFQGIALAFYSTGAVTFASCVETRDTSAAIAMYSLFTMIGLGIGTSVAPWIYGVYGFSSVLELALVTVTGAMLIMWLHSKPVPLCPSEMRVPFKVVLTTKEVLAPSICLFASNFSLGAAFTFVPLLALSQGIGSYSIFFVSFSIAVVCARVAVQYTNRRWSSEKTSFGASFLNVMGLLLLAFLPSVLSFVLSGILIGFGFGIIFPTLVGYLVQRVDASNKGTALGILSGAGDIGNALGASVLGIVAQTMGFMAVFSAASLITLACMYYFYRTLLSRGRNQSQAL